jgi:D-aminopeptidase
MSLPVRGYWVNGVSVGEMGLQALIAGHYGVPFIFSAGDAHACVEAEELIPGCVTAPVKTGLSLHTALSLSHPKACERIRERAEASIAQVEQVKPLDPGAPILFREERHNADFDPENPPAHSRVIDSHTREVEAEDVIDLVCKLYGYSPDWRPMNFVL